jgi:transcriptional adapter 3
LSGLAGHTRSLTATPAETSSSISSPASLPTASLPEMAARAAKKDGSSPSSAASPHQPPPAAAVQKTLIFGHNPADCDDPTIYHIRDITPDMTEAELKEILNVGDYPHDDLHDKTCGTPPDRDFSNARPANQIAASTFANFVEPYIRPLTEEDRAFLVERGDREKPFLMPKRGARHYRDIWAEEDNGMIIDSNSDRPPPNDSRGDIEQMDDAMAESEELSTGPVLSRLLTLLRNQSNNADENQSNGVNGTEMAIDGETNENRPEPQPPATQLPDWKNQPMVGRQDGLDMDDRILQELRYIGFLSPTENPDYNANMDDEVAARLRYLQSELRKQSIINGARKARLMEITEERMAMQEWQTIAEDLDSQLNQAYLKRNRNISKKGNKVKRPGGAGGGSHVVGVARPGGNAIGEPIRQLMERKSKWEHWIGPVVDYGKTSIPNETIFDRENMERLIQKEQETWGVDDDV